MDNLLKKIEKEIVDELQQKLPTSDDGATKLISQMVKISAQVTRMFLEKYENELKKNQ